MAAPERQRSDSERLDDLLLELRDQRAKVDEVLALLKRRRRAAGKRRGTVAERSADRVESEPAAYQPTELQRARVRRALLKVPR